MNKAILMGRLTRNPDIRYTRGQKQTCVARYTIAVDRRFKREGEPDADFINCVAFGKQGEFAEKYLKQGTKIVVCGRIETGSYTAKDGHKVYTTDIVVEEQDFAESKKAAAESTGNPESVSQTQRDPEPPTETVGDGFMQIPEGFEDELPFT